MSYPQRLEFLNLETLELRRLRKDLKMTYKILCGLVDVHFHDFFAYSTYTATRSNSKNLVLAYAPIDSRQYFFCIRVIEPWNNLPENVVTAQSLQTFSNRLASCDLSRYVRGGI